MLSLKRFAAAYIDFCIATIFHYIVIFSIFGIKWFEDNSIGKLLLTVALGTVIFAIKDILSPSIGKRILKLKIVNVKDGSCASLWKRLVRNLFIVIHPLIDIVTMLVRKDHRKLLDVWLGINVIEQKTGEDRGRFSVLKKKNKK